MTLFFRSSPSSSCFSSRQQLHITTRLFGKKKKSHLNSSNFKNDRNGWPWYHAVLLGFSLPDSLCRNITTVICCWCLRFVNFLVILARPDQVLVVLAADSVFHFYCSWRPPKGPVIPAIWPRLRWSTFQFLVLVITFITLLVASTWTTGESLGTSGFLAGFENTKSASHVISSALQWTLTFRGGANSHHY